MRLAHAAGSLCDVEHTQAVGISELPFNPINHGRFDTFNPTKALWRQRIGHVYDMIVLFTLAAVVAILLKLFLN
jgi:hypothetical protein